MALALTQKFLERLKLIPLRSEAEGAAGVGCGGGEGRYLSDVSRVEGVRCRMWRRKGASGVGYFEGGERVDHGSSRPLRAEHGPDARTMSI